MGQQNKTVDNMNYSTTREDLINKHEYLKTAFQLLNKKLENTATVLNEVNTFIEEHPEDTHFIPKKGRLLEKQQSISNDLKYILNQMEATKKAINNLDVGKAVNDWLHTPENLAFDRELNRVMACSSSGLQTEPQKRSVATDEERRKWKAETETW